MIRFQAVFVAILLLSVGPHAVAQKHVSFNAPMSFTMEIEPSYIVAVDLTGSGILDLVMTSPAGLTMALGRGDGTFQDAHPTAQSVCYRPSTAAMSTIIGSDNIITLLGNGDGTFRPPIVGPYYGAGFLAVADFNNDGKLDVAAAGAINYSRGNTVEIFLGQGNGSFAAPGFVATVGYGPTGLAVGDFNHDGHLDIATANSIDNNVTTLLGDGTGAFKTAGISGGVSDPHRILAVDLNGDGNLDLIATNIDSSDVTVLVGRGDGSFLQAERFWIGVNRGASLRAISTRQVPRKTSLCCKTRPRHIRVRSFI